MPSYLQTTSTECGLACLGYIAAHHGNHQEMAALRTRFAISMHGTNLAAIMRFSSLLHLQARPLRLDVSQLYRLMLPCILHWNLNHFVVLIACQRGKIKIHDPARGECTLTLEEASAHFTGIALELSPTPDFQLAQPKPLIHWRQLTGKIYGLKRSLGQLLTLAVGLQVVALVAPVFTQWIVDGAIVSADTDLLWVILIGAVLLTFIRVILESARSWLSTIISTQFSTQWGARVMGHLLHVPMQWFEIRQTGDVVSRFQSVQSIQQTVTGKLVDIMLDGLFATIVLLVMLLYSAKLALVVILAVAGYVLIRVFPHGAFHRATDKALTHEARAQTHFLESLRAMQAIKLAGLEEQRQTRWQNLTVLGTNLRLATQKMTIAFGAGYSLISGLESIAILGWGAHMTIQGTLTVGMLMAFIAYKDEFSARMQRFIDNLMSIRMLKLHVERLSDIVLAEKEKLEGTIPQGLEKTESLDTSIRLENVGFRYGSEAAWVLRHVNLEIKMGEHVALVGPTGCGKTTLAKLILGLIEPTEGHLTIGGLPLSQVGVGAWRRKIAAVMQDDQLFSASLMENIAGFDEDIDTERVQQAAKSAAIHDEIMAMPMGYHSLNGDMGSSLSGGQKQRITLARAFYRNPKVLILDEATSHLDVHKERLVNEAICQLAVTRITIAHRPETIAMAERVITLNGLPKESLNKA